MFFNAIQNFKSATKNRKEKWHSTCLTAVESGLKRISRVHIFYLSKTVHPDQTWHSITEQRIEVFLLAAEHQNIRKNYTPFVVLGRNTEHTFISHFRCSVFRSHFTCGIVSHVLNVFAKCNIVSFSSAQLRYLSSARHPTVFLHNCPVTLDRLKFVLWIATMFLERVMIRSVVSDTKIKILHIFN